MNLPVRYALSLNGSRPLPAADIDQRISPLQTERDQRTALKDSYLAILSAHDSLHGAVAAVGLNQPGKQRFIGFYVVGNLHKRSTVFPGPS